MCGLNPLLRIPISKLSRIRYFTKWEILLEKSFSFYLSREKTWQTVWDLAQIKWIVRSRPERFGLLWSRLSYRTELSFTVLQSSVSKSLLQLECFDYKRTEYLHVSMKYYECNIWTIRQPLLVFVHSLFLVELLKVKFWQRIHFKCNKIYLYLSNTYMSRLFPNRLNPVWYMIDYLPYWNTKLTYVKLDLAYFGNRRLT